MYAVDRSDMRRRYRTSADGAGRFVLGNLSAGNYGVHAYKESAGYPDSFFSFFATSKNAWRQV